MRTVWVLRGEKPESTRVRAGLTDGLFTELLALTPGSPPSLAENDVLITNVNSNDKPKPRMRIF